VSFVEVPPPGASRHPPRRWEGWRPWMPLWGVRRKHPYLRDLAARSARGLDRV